MEEYNFIDRYYSDTSGEAKNRLIENWEGCKSIIRDSLLSQCNNAYKIIQICLIICIITFTAYAVLYKKCIFVSKHKNSNSKGAILLKACFFISLIIGLVSFIMLIIWEFQFKTVTGFNFWQFQ